METRSPDPPEVPRVDQPTPAPMGSAPPPPLWDTERGAFSSARLRQRMVADTHALDFMHGVGGLSMDSQHTLDHAVLTILQSQEDRALHSAHVSGRLALTDATTHLGALQATRQQWDTAQLHAALAAETDASRRCGVFQAHAMARRQDAGDPTPKHALETTLLHERHALEATLLHERRAFDEAELRRDHEQALARLTDKHVMDQALLAQHQAWTTDALARQQQADAVALALEHPGQVTAFRALQTHLVDAMAQRHSDEWRALTALHGHELDQETHKETVARMADDKAAEASGLG
ncbi:Aste57867_15030 [Aphanomyces stellatus]|uniref:Aste57867_15030 protein n=1 Tax=Aphanomyces stellatus TaxID=120398 RepID=A0A485L278_9STRA|nr:hypothetical protein As57867_014974 [Aphanomyces stellatus]VFT91844.1 Aste57867_15030 [Aphanomyces stellatus]